MLPVTHCRVPCNLHNHVRLYQIFGLKPLYCSKISAEWQRCFVVEWNKAFEEILTVWKLLYCLLLLDAHVHSHEDDHLSWSAGTLCKKSFAHYLKLKVLLLFTIHSHTYTHDLEADHGSGETSCINHGKTTCLITVSHILANSGCTLTLLDSHMWAGDVIFNMTEHLALVVL